MLILLETKAVSLFCGILHFMLSIHTFFFVSRKGKDEGLEITHHFPLGLNFGYFEMIFGEFRDGFYRNFG